MVNTQNVDTLLSAMRGELEAFQKLKIGFNMGCFIRKTDRPDFDKTGNHCGTVACIAGTAAILATKGAKRQSILNRGLGLDTSEYIDVPEVAREWLGLSEAQAERLFYANGRRDAQTKDLTLVSHKRAITVVQRLRDTGKVSWR